jgi:hypothetical protein
MNFNESILHKFYTAFENANTIEMCACYHPKIQFSDPVFGLLKGNEVCDMWQMLIDRSKGNLKINFSEIKADEYTGSVQWIAIYNFSKTNRKVVNKIHAQFQFQDGLIIKHTDDFDIWKWSMQALGWKGCLLGWTGFFQKKIQNNAINTLKAFSKTNQE